MAYVLKLLDERSMVPRPGDAGVVLFLRLSETGYRGRALIVGPGGRPLREGARVISTCPVAATQDLYLVCTSAGWPMESIGVAADSQFRTDEIMRGGQQIQAIDWSADHRSVVDILADSFGPYSRKIEGQPQQPAQPAQPPERPQPSPRVAQRALPAPAEKNSSTAMAPRSQRRNIDELGDDEQHALLVLSGAAKKLRAGEKASDIIPLLDDALSFLRQPDDDENFDGDEDEYEDEDEDEDDELIEDEDSDHVEIDSNDASADLAKHPDVGLRPMRALMPGEVPPGLNAEQVAQFSALSDPAAEQKMRRSFERATSASAHARSIAEANERARSQAQASLPEPLSVPVQQIQAPAHPVESHLASAALASPAPPSSEALQTANFADLITSVDPASPVLPDVPSGPPFVPVKMSAPFGEPTHIYDRRWYSIEQVAMAFGVTVSTVRNRIRDGLISGVIRTPIPGARGVPRLLIPVESVSG